jgi:Zn-finger protein
MAIYICDYCNEMKDDDYFPMVESKDSQYVWLCEDCSLEVEEEAEEIPGFEGTTDALNRLGK